ncbi:sensor histidine kinase [Diplocloster agilis]|uniref:Histidine kinase n=1 Tax=Diplocloster agilis TaxID=2850323 RepID=A0A949JU31_9FIRM|nr:histidine kinase [Diplocloster agilis]MBU9735125.1 histidine kinase [Diplocloster agilis]
MTKISNIYHNLNTHFRDMHLYNKFVVVIAPLLLLTVFAILIISDLIFARHNLVQEKQSVLDEMQILQNQIMQIHNDMITCSNLAAKDVDDIYSQYFPPDDDNVSFISVRNSLSSVLNYNRNCFPNIASAVFMDIDGNTVSSGLKNIPDARDLQATFTDFLTLTGPPSSLFLPIRSRSVFDSVNQEPVFTLIKRIISSEHGDTLGYLFLNVEEPSFSSLFPKSEDKVYMIADMENQIVSSNDKSLLFQYAEQSFPTLDFTQENAVIQDDSTLYFMSSRSSANIQWKLISCVSLKYIKKSIWLNTGLVICIGLAAVAVAIYFLYRISRLVTQPIKNLTDTVCQIQTGDLNVTCPIDSRSETGILAQGFNQMIGTVKDLLVRVEQEQCRKREYEFALMQAQIKPHFLYNALDLIYVLCCTGENTEAGITTKALADYYRLSLSGGDEVIPLKDELSHVENYLLIQKARYCDILDYYINVPDELTSFQIPKMTLQPLVENAIYHGLKEKADGGMVCITGRMQMDAIFLEVMDDGIGIEGQRLLNILAEESKGHYGLYNVNKRIKLYFGEEYGVDISSEPGLGTRVCLRLPKALSNLF